MIKLIIVGRRAPGTTRAQMARHLKFVHGPMVYDAPADAGPMPSAYVQNHVYDGAYPAGGASPYAHERDLVTEVWFDSLASLGGSTQTPYYKTHLAPDEDLFVDQATVVKGAYEATARTRPEAGRFKLFVFLKAVAAEARSDLQARCADVFAAAATEPGVRDRVSNTPLLRPGIEPFSHAVEELWFDDRAAAAHFAEAALPGLLARFPPDLLDPLACLHLQAQEFSVERLRAERASAGDMHPSS